MIRALVAVLLLATSARATDYYVDFVNGSNNNAGTIGSPFQTVPGSHCKGTPSGTVPVTVCKVQDTGGGSTWNTVNFVAGDRILLHGGQSHEYLIYPQSNRFQVNPASPITFDSYGGGSSPILEGGNDITRLVEATGVNGWTPIGGTNPPANIYSYAFDFTRLFYTCGNSNGFNTPGVEQPDTIKLVGNGLRFAKGGDPNYGYSRAFTCDATGLPTFAMVSVDCANSRICVRTSASNSYDAANDPRIDGSHWYVGWRPWGINDDGINNLTIQNIDTRRSSLVVSGGDYGGGFECQNDSGTAGCSHINLNNFNVTLSGGVGISFPGFNITGNDTNNTIQHLIVDNSYVYGLQIVDVNPTTSQSWLIDHVESRFNGDHGISNGNINGAQYTHVNLHNNAVSDTLCGTGPCGSVGQATASGMGFANRNGSVCRNVTVDHSIFHDNGTALSNEQAGAGIFMSSLDGNNVFTNNLFYRNWGGAMMWNPAVTTANWTILNNTMVNDKLAEFQQETGTFGNTSSTMLFENNILQRDTGIQGGGSAGLAMMHITAGQATSAWTVDYDDSFHTGTCPSNLFCKYYYGTYTDTPPTGFDVHARGCAPSYTNQGLNDYSLLGTDACVRNFGTSTAPIVTDDIIGTPRPQQSIYDIGAYEFDAGATTTTTSTSTSSTTTTSTSSTSTTSTSTSSTTSSTVPGNTSTTSTSTSVTTTTATSTTTITFLPGIGILQDGGSISNAGITG